MADHNKRIRKTIILLGVTTFAVIVPLGLLLTYSVIPPEESHKSVETQQADCSQWIVSVGVKAQEGRARSIAGYIMHDNKGKMEFDYKFTVSAQAPLNHDAWQFESWRFTDVTEKQFSLAEVKRKVPNFEALVEEQIKLLEK